MTERKGVLFLLALVCGGAASMAPGQRIDVPDWEGSVRFELLASQNAVRPDDDLEVAVVVEITPGYHLYGPEERKPSRTDGMVLGDRVASRPAVFPPVVRRDLSGLGEFDLYEGSIAIRIPISVGEDAAGRAEVPVEVRVNYQVCTDHACSAPTHRVLSLRLPVAKEGARIESRHEDIFVSTK